MTPPPNGHPTTRELSISVEDLERRVEKSEANISETRRTMTKVEQMIAILDTNVKYRVGLMEKWIVVIMLGIMGMVGKTIWDAIFSRKIVP